MTGFSQGNEIAKELNYLVWKWSPAGSGSVNGGFGWMRRTMTRGFAAALRPVLLQPVAAVLLTTIDMSATSRQLVQSAREFSVHRSICFRLISIFCVGPCHRRPAITRVFETRDPGNFAICVAAGSPHLSAVLTRSGGSKDVDLTMPMRFCGTLPCVRSA